MKTLIARRLAPLLVLVCAPAVAGSPVWGIGRAKDGDSLTVGKAEVRLFGIDAPEFDQTCLRGGGRWNCGAAASDELARLVTGKDVRCEGLGKDDFGRVLARCYVGSREVNRTMVALGFAVAFRRYSSDYVSAEESAKVAKRGLWVGTFEMPEAYRHPAEPVGRGARERRVQARSGRQASRNAEAECNIKGNRNRKGQWIYHVPGMPYYDQTRPEEIFCSEAQAQAAGYRRALVR
jgi:endonuclease YncB( thermonuclease family)